MATKDFVPWLQSVLDERGWSQRQLAERAQISPTQMSRLFRGERQPGIDAMTGIARALGLPLETVMRHAGWLPSLPGELLPEVLSWNERLIALSEEDREAVIFAMEQSLKLIEGRPEYRARRGTRGDR